MGFRPTTSRRFPSRPSPIARRLPTSRWGCCPRSPRTTSATSAPAELLEKLERLIDDDGGAGAIPGSPPQLVRHQHAGTAHAALRLHRGQWQPRRRAHRHRGRAAAPGDQPAARLGDLQRAPRHRGSGIALDGSALAVSRHVTVRPRPPARRAHGGAEYAWRQPTMPATGSSALECSCRNSRRPSMSSRPTNHRSRTGSTWPTGPGSLAAGLADAPIPPDAARQVPSARRASAHLRRRDELPLPLRPPAPDLRHRLSTRRCRRPGSARSVLL